MSIQNQRRRKKEQSISGHLRALLISDYLAALDLKHLIRLQVLSAPLV